MVLTRSQKARGVQPTPLVASSGAHHNPRRVQLQPSPEREGGLSRQRSARVICDRIVVNSARVNGGIPVTVAGMLLPEQERADKEPEEKRNQRSNKNKTPEGEIQQKRCMKKRCKTKDILRESITFKGNYKKNIYKVKNDRKCELNCHTENVVYLMTCDNCNLQYVGETVQELSERQNHHRNSIHKHTEDKHDTKLVEHFNEGKCKGKTYNLMIIETIVGTGRDKETNKMDQKQTAMRRKREDYWIKELHTLYPYGMNNKLGNVTLEQRDITEPICKEFIVNKKSSKKRSRKRWAKEIKCGDTIYEDITKPFTTAQENHNTNILEDAIKKAMSILPQLRKNEMKKVANRAMEDICESKIPTRLLQIIQDTAIGKLIKPGKKPGEKPKKKIGKIIKTLFVNKGMEKIQFSKILHNPALKETLPNFIKEKDPPTVVYSYTPTIRSKIFNYRQTIEELDEKWKYDETSCDCEESEFKDEHHKHVVTGKLKIVREKNLQKLCRKGPNFRERNSTNWDVCLKLIKSSIIAYVNSWSKKENKDVSCFAEWKAEVIKVVTEKIETLKDTYKERPLKKVMKRKESIEELQRLQNKYVMVPIDKTSNNIGFICKRYYYKLLVDELQTSTYEQILKEKDEVIREITNKCSEQKQQVPEENKALPIIYICIKMHKKPVKFRYIIASRRSVTKQPSKKLTKILQLIKKITKRYCEKIFLFTGINHYWVSDGTEQILKDIDRLNNRKRARNIESFDFSTLYTKIPQEDLKKKLKEIVNRAFKGGVCKYIQVNKYGARWASKGNKDDTYSCEDVENLIDLVFDNAVFIVGKKIYRQIIGMVMGVDPAPPAADLYLHADEARYMRKLTKENYHEAKMYNHTHRFIDDLCSINNNGHLLKHKEIIYDKSLILNKENEGEKSTTFLDLSIQIEEKMIMTKTYDKRDDFKFEIINFPDITGNIPENTGYNVIASQLIRHSRNCSRWFDAKEKIKNLIKTLKEKMYNMEK